MSCLQAPARRSFRGSRMHALVALAPMLLKNVLEAQPTSPCWLAILPMDLLLTILERAEGLDPEFRHGFSLSPTGRYVPKYDALVSVVHSFGERGTGEGQFRAINQLAYASNGNLFCTDMYNARVHERNGLTGDLVQTIDLSSTCRRPVGIALSRRPAGSFYVSDWAQRRVCEYRLSDGAFQRVVIARGLGEGLVVVQSRLFGLSLSPDESQLAVIDEGRHAVLIIRLDGSEAARAVGCHGTGEGQFRNPVDVAFSPDGKHYCVADLVNCCVQVIAVVDGSFVRRIRCGDMVSAVAVAIDGSVLVQTTRGMKVFSLEGILLHDSIAALPDRPGDITARETLVLNNDSGRASLAICSCRGLVAVATSSSQHKSVCIL